MQLTLATDRGLPARSSLHTGRTGSRLSNPSPRFPGQFCVAQTDSAALLVCCHASLSSEAVTLESPSEVRNLALSVQVDDIHVKQQTESHTEPDTVSKNADVLQNTHLRGSNSQASDPTPASSAAVTVVATSSVSTEHDVQSSALDPPVPNGATETTSTQDHAQFQLSSLPEQLATATTLSVSAPQADGYISRLSIRCACQWHPCIAEQVRGPLKDRNPAAIRKMVSAGRCPC